MAQPLARQTAIELLDEAARLLRQAPLSTLLCHWSGSVPLAIGVLVCWNTLTTGLPSDAACAWGALELALLAIWMNCRRAVFAGRLRAQLSGAPAPAWTWPRAARLAATQSFLGGTRLAALPLAVLTGFPLAATVAFYRNAAVLAGRDDLDPVEVLSRARALAAADRGQAWAVLPLLALLQLIVALNLALAFAVLPVLVRMLTGYESELSRAELSFVQSPLFLMLVLAASWAVFDPFIQAVYCVRCFHGESLATGEDLRVALRRIAASATAMAAVPPGELADAVRHSMQSPEYAWRIPPPPRHGGAGGHWIVAVTDKILAVLHAIVSAIGKAIEAVVRWLFGRWMIGPAPQGGKASAAALHWTVYLLIAAVAGAAIWFIWKRGLLRPRGRAPGAASASAAAPVDDETLDAARLPEERWLQLADEHLRSGNYRLALRALYLANLAWLGRAGFLAIDAGKTNREYAHELRRKARAFPEARGLFAANIAAFEEVWYGMRGASGERVAAFRDRIENMKRVLA